jgi:hypothetical protein
MIDNWPGYAQIVWYYRPQRAISKFLLEAFSAFTPDNADSYNFDFFPGAKSWEGLKSAVVVSCQSDSVVGEGLKKKLPIIYGILESIHIQGPMVPKT